MSLLNFRIWTDRALLSVDTQCDGGPGIGQFEMSKVLLLPHTNVLFAFRGGQHLLVQIFGTCFMQGSNADYDGIDAYLMDGLNVGYETFVQAEITRGVPEAVARDGAALVVVGFSKSAGEMCAMRYERAPNEKEFRKKVQNCGLEPNAGWKRPPIPDTAEMHQQIARDQVAFIRREHPGYPIGGRLLLVELTKDTATFREVCDLG